MNILISCQYFNYCSGSAMYVHDLAVELHKRGNEVTILSDLGGEIANSAIKAGIKVVDFSQIFSIQNEKFDVMHLNQYHPAEMALEFFPEVPAVFTIHSELNIETPYIHPTIKKYIAVRPTIVEKYKQLSPIQIWNGIDFERFNTKNKEEFEQKKDEARAKGPLKEIVLFVGTIDNLRAAAIKELITVTEESNQELWLVGRSFLPFKIPEDKAKTFPETFFVEKWIGMSDVCAGILVGRTAIEAWACGKPYICYTVDDSGKVLGKPEYLMPPEDMHEYDITFMTDKVEAIYKEITTQ